jgi:hypothetical protein
VLYALELKNTEWEAFQMKLNILIPHESRGKELAEKVKLMLSAHNCTCLLISGSGSRAIDTVDIDKYSHFFIVLNRKAVKNLTKNRDEFEKQYSKKIEPFWTFVAGKFPERLVVVRVNPDPEADFANALSNIYNERTFEVGSDKSIDVVATDVVKNFEEIVASKAENKNDKLEILSSWSETKRLLGRYAPADKLSITEEISLANHLLHSLEACYYYNDENDFRKLLERITPSYRSVLHFVRMLIETSMDMFSNSAALTGEIRDKLFAQIEENLKSIHDFVEENKDQEGNRNLILWLKWFCDIRLALLCGSEIINPSGTAGVDPKRAKTYLDLSENALDEIKKSFSYDENYVNLFYGYLYLNKYQIEKVDNENSIKSSIDHFGAFYAYYNRLDVALKDTYLSDCFEMELNFSRNELLRLKPESSEYNAKYRGDVSSFIEKAKAKKKHSKLQYLINNGPGIPGSTP